MAWFSRRSRNKRASAGPEPGAPRTAAEVATAAAQVATAAAQVAAAAAEPAGEPHTLRTFGESLANLAGNAMQMGDLVTRMVDRSAIVFLSHDVAQAKALIQLDLEVDSRKDALLAQSLEVLARHQPVASDLRLLLAVEHIAGDLERSADHAKNIAKRTLSLTNTAKFDPTIDDLIRRLHAAVRAMLKDSLTAFSTRDTALALELGRRDLVPDSINDDLFHAVIARLQTDPSHAPTDIQALFVGKSLERIGDHATNIADEARFLARGDVPSATRAR